MDKTLYTREQAVLMKLLRELRQEAGLRQQDLAGQIGEPQSFVSKIESGERRLDILEMRQLCRAFGLSLTQFVRRLENELSRA